MKKQIVLMLLILLISASSASLSFGQSAQGLMELFLQAGDPDNNAYTLDFGDLYQADIDFDYPNNPQIIGLFTNLRVNTPWRAQSDPELTFDPPSGIATKRDPKRTPAITVHDVSVTWKPLASGPGTEVTREVQMIFAEDPNSPDQIDTITVTIKANIYARPDVTHVAPALGSNGKVNVTVGAWRTFRVNSGDPSFPGASISKFQWQTQIGNQPSLPPEDAKWEDRPKTGEIMLKFDSAGDYTVYARMVDSNDVVTQPVEIPVRAWERPAVLDEPIPEVIPTDGNQDGVFDTLELSAKASWLGGQYVGVVGQPVTLIAAGDPQNDDPTEVITTILWYLDSDGTFDGAQPASALFYPFPSNGPAGGNLDEVSLDVVAQYIEDNNVPPSVVSTFSTINFPNTGGAFIHANDFNTKLEDHFFARFVGAIIVEKAGAHTFHVRSDDGFRLKIGNTVVGKFTGRRAYDANETTNTYNFTEPGFYPFELTYFEWHVGAGLTMGWTPPNGGSREFVPVTSVLRYTWNTPTLSGKIKAKAVTNFGVESNEKTFDLRVYDTVQVNAGGSYTGRPTQAVKLDGSINTDSFPGASVSYQWRRVGGGAIDSEPDGSGTYTWTADGLYEVELEATVTTSEGLELMGRQKANVRIESGVPTARPGGPYRGGIAGGNFTPIQFEGNPPDFIEAPDVGKIDMWEWVFPTGITKDARSGLAGSFYDYSSLSGVSNTPTLDEIESKVNAQNLQPNLTQVFDTIDFPKTSGALTHSNGFDTKLADKFFARFTGFIEIDTAGAYQFHVSSDDGFRLKIDGTTVAQHTTTRGIAETLGTMEFSESGIYPLELTYFEHTSDAGLKLEWTPPGGSIQEIVPSNVLFTNKLTEWNPTQEYRTAGEFDIKLRVHSEFGKWSSVATTTVTVIDGEIEGFVRAADLRTPVRDVKLTLTSSHVDPTTLARIASEDDDLNTNADRGIWTLTDDDGKYRFAHLPLGSYRIVASRVDGTGNDATIHEFETPVQATELTLDAPEQLAIDYVDLSVFPVGGRVVYRLQRNGVDVLVDGVSVIAQSIGSDSTIEANPSTSLSPTNYSMPLFAGRYLFLAKKGNHTIRVNKTTPGYDSATGLTTIDGAKTDLDFIDSTTRTIKVFVEDSGGFPIEQYTDVGGNTVTVQVEVTGDNGFAESNNVDRSTENDLQTVDRRTFFKAIVPPGNKYTVSLPNVPTAIVKGNSSQKQADVDVTTSDGEVTMVVPVKIELEISPPPKLLDGRLPDEFFAAVGLTRDDNPEGFMAYNPDTLQRHTYTIVATANGKVVPNFTLRITDDVSQLDTSPAVERTYPDPNDSRYAAQGSGDSYLVEYTISGGLPRRSIVDENDPTTYVEYTLPDNTTVNVPRAIPKTVTFRASKDGYEDSNPITLEVTVLGDLPEGSAPEIVAVPNVNYLVLHDPPGDGSYSYIDDTLTVRGIVPKMQIKSEIGASIPVYPSPWSVERDIDGVDFGDIKDGNNNLGDRGILDPREPFPASGAFAIAAAYESIKGGIVAASGSFGLGIGLQLVNAAAVTLFLAEETSDVIPGLSAVGIIQHEISPSRHLETPSGDELPDLNGPGKGDVYYGEGWTLGLQTKFRLGIKQYSNFDSSKASINYNPRYPDRDDAENPTMGWNNPKWIPDSAQIETYAILDRDNQYAYTIRDIENITANLETQIAALGTPDENSTEATEKLKLESARDTWNRLLDDNPAYVWQRDYIRGDNPNNRQELEKFLANEFRNQNGESLIFSAGPAFEYSRTVAESQVTSFSTSVSVATSAGYEGKAGIEVGVWAGLGGGVLAITSGGGTTGELGIETSQEFGAELESGSETEQTVGFALQDDDIGDNISTYVYRGPWGTPIFFTDPGSVTSDPWQEGTNKAVDFTLELVDQPSNTRPFDYHDGAHYKIKINYTGKRVLESSGISFVAYPPQVDNSGGLTVRFNGAGTPYGGIELSKESATVDINVSLYPPEIDMLSAAEQDYPIVIQVEQEDDYQIAQALELRPSFADLSPPRAVITAPYDGQRISPSVFTGGKEFEIEVFSDDHDVAKIQLERRNKQPDGVWSSWQIMNDIIWEENVPNADVEVVTHSDREPVRRVFTFKWPSTNDRDGDGTPDWNGDNISELGVGEYQLRAVASDKATRLSADGSTQNPQPNVDVDPPAVTFLVDESPPTVLTSVPFYQDKEKDRIYRAELSVTFTDDMRADDFTDRTFEVTDLLAGGKRVSGFVSYSPALRKTVFVPVVPFQPNGFYRAVVKTDSEQDDSTIERGVRDLAGNPLDNEFSWTFRTTDSPFEEKWSIGLSATDDESTDGNNIAAVEFGVSDDEDERDARAVPGLTSQLQLSFVNPRILEGSAPVEFDRDIRPADGRLSHHWFFVVKNPTGRVTLRWKPSSKLVRSQELRQYKNLWLVEYVDHDSAQDTALLQTNRIPLDPSVARDGEGLPAEVQIYTFTTGEYTNTNGTQVNFSESVRYFRLDVEKASFVATTLTNGATGWKFISAPITPERADAFVNFGDDIDPFQLFKYDTAIGGYKVYPLDLGEVALQTGHGYFTRLKNDVEVDGAANQADMILTLDAAGWHAIGNPFVKDVNVADLSIGGKSFDQAVTDGDIEATLYQWNTNDTDNDGESDDGYLTITNANQLTPWEGYWLKTKEPNLTLTFPTPAELNNFIPALPASYQPPAAPPVAAQTSNQTAEQPGRFNLRLKLISKRSADVTTSLGTHPKAALGWDRLDTSEPPTLTQTVSAHFDHKARGASAGLYNTDYQPLLGVGESRTWQLTTFADGVQSPMRLSWEDAIGQIPDDMMLSFRKMDGQAEAAKTGGTEDPQSSLYEWQDMRKVQDVEIASKGLVTKVTFGMRAERFAMAPPADVQVVAGEAQVRMQWAADDNPFISSYTIERQATQGKPAVTEHAIRSTQHEFLDTDVEEEMSYTYQLSVRFKSGAELYSERFTVTVLPVIKETILLQSYPNPFNPEIWIPYELATDGKVTMEIYNVHGHLVRRLNLGFQTRGRYTSREKAAYWDGRNKYGERSASGVYFYVMKSGDYTATRKMVVLK